MRAVEIEAKALLDPSHSMAGELPARFRYPYEALPKLGAWIAAVGPQLSSDEYEKRGEQIWTHKSTKAAPSVNLTGPLTVRANVEFRHCAYFRGNVLIGAGNVTGNPYELKNSLPFGSVEAPHYNYVGDLILGYHAHVNAGSITNNIKSDRKNIVIRTDDGAIETGSRKTDVIFGDYVEVGCGTALDPGSVAGKNTMIYPLASVRGPVPANSIVKSAENIVIEQN